MASAKSATPGGGQRLLQLTIVASVILTPVPFSTASLAHERAHMRATPSWRHLRAESLRLRGGYLYPSQPKPAHAADAADAAIKTVEVTFEVICEVAKEERDNLLIIGEAPQLGAWYGPCGLDGRRPESHRDRHDTLERMEN